ncbi:MAG: lamin tail domain-containing protein [Candidatus Pacebacteria bacterium]|nr:lamin tail domain-containing protein [Candidatus Paceibacterota bacterium]
MSKKLILVFVCVVFFSSFHVAFASLTINEIMYDLSGSDSVNGKSREWIEIYNSDSSDVSVDASKWRIYDGGENRTINGGTDFSVPANSYVIFAGDKDTFLADNPNFSGTVYDTGITSLNNTGATLKILDQDGNVVDAVTYTSSEGGAGDGNSLQLIDGTWVGATPTPGAVNVASSNDTSSSDNSTVVVSGGLPANVYNANSGNQNTVTQNQSQNKTSETSQIQCKISSKNIGFVGLPVLLQATAFGISGEKLYFGKYFWNFGDGDSKDVNLTDTAPLTHTYFYPGNYVVSLDYYQNYYSGISAPDASSQITIKIIPTDISISNVGNDKDFFVELTNNTDYNADISNWVLTSDQKKFTFPQDTIIISKQKMTLSPKITNFSMADENSLKLNTPEGNTIFAYAVSPALVVMPVVSIAPTVDKPTDVGRLAAYTRPTSGFY